MPQLITKVSERRVRALGGMTAEGGSNGQDIKKRRGTFEIVQWVGCFQKVFTGVTIQ